MKNTPSIWARIAAPLIVAGIICLGLSLVSVAIFCIIVLVFVFRGELSYLSRYFVLMGYFPTVNSLFMYNYLIGMIGSLGLPFLGSGLLANWLGNKKH